MPYIPQHARELACIAPANAGELNYAFTDLAWQYLGPNPNYQLFNDVIGALEGCKLELYRRKVGPYEDVKITQNGDIR